MCIGPPPVVWWAQMYCLSSLFASGSFLGETVNNEGPHTDVTDIFSVRHPWRNKEQPERILMKNNKYFLLVAGEKKNGFAKRLV